MEGLMYTLTENQFFSNEATVSRMSQQEFGNAYFLNRNDAEVIFFFVRKKEKDN